MNRLYPLKFKPIFKDKIWGGQKVKTHFGMDYSPLPNCGEAWLISGYNDEQSVVSDGFLEGNELNELLEVYMEELVGDNVYERCGNEFPILVKLIDSRDWLSIQVHPDDQLARKRKLGNGKTEMWYVLDAGEDSELISGFNRKMSKGEYLDHLENNKLREILNFEKVHAGDVYYIPAGRVHALGPGVFLAEIQQTSDTTYRIYDWNRLQPDGTFRELHKEEALDAIDFEIPEKYRTEYEVKHNETSELISSPHFTTNLISLNKALKKDYSLIDSFVIYLCVEGDFVLEHRDGKIPVSAGEALLIPAVLNEISIYPAGPVKLLETYLI